MSQQQTLTCKEHHATPGLSYYGLVILLKIHSHMPVETKLKDSNTDVIVIGHSDVRRKTSQKIHYIPLHKFEVEFLILYRSDSNSYGMQICCGFPEDKI